jgi:transcription termination factor NusB
MGLRHTGRELALKALYQIDIHGAVSNEDLALFFESFAGNVPMHLRCAWSMELGENEVQSMVSWPMRWNIGQSDVCHG